MNGRDDDDEVESLDPWGRDPDWNWPRPHITGDWWWQR